MLTRTSTPACTGLSFSPAESCDFPSTWKASSQNSRTSTDCQTDPVQQKDVKIQVVKRASVETQTENQPSAPEEPQEKKHYDKPSLYAFLNRATPLILRQLERNSRSTAFRHLRQQSRQLYLEQVRVVGSGEAQVKDFAALCTAASHPDHGDEIAVGYGSSQHADWCGHAAKLAVFRRRDLEARPKVFEMDSCVSCVAYNARKAVLTCGMYTGEIVCWDGEEQLQVGGRHSGRVSSLQWRPVYERKRLLSAAVDGAAKLWKIREKALVVSEEFVVTSWDADVKLTSSIETPIGITATGFSMFDDSQFLIGTEGGYVMLGSLAATHGVFENAKKCVTMTFKRHQGHVTSASFSSHSRNVFLTSSVDKRARVYSQLQPSPVISLVHPDQIVKAAWSRARQLHIATATFSGRIAFYDIRKAYKPLAETELSRKITDFGFVAPDQLAVTTTNGDLHLLQLSEGLLADVDPASLDVVVNSLQDGIGFE